uniref:Uncharacterized protein n=1 Tax=Mus musculus TaxID=10090 RepID=Q3TQN8_MOUSE|nr:unnamed protein product [Mus musculus]BAE37344.1 unnamed protein product [Mus musculus]
MCLDSRWLPNRKYPCDLGVAWQQHLSLCAFLGQGFVVFLLYKVCLKPPPRRVSFYAVVRESKGKRNCDIFCCQFVGGPCYHGFTSKWGLF